MRNLKFALAGLACAICASAPAFSEAFNIPAGDLATALNAYTKQTGVALIISGEEVRGSRTAGVKGDYSAENALSKLLTGTGFIEHRRATGAIGIVRANSAQIDVQPSLQLAAAPAPAASNAALETVTVTSSKLGGDVQNIPISITALSQEQLTATQTVGGPDLVKQVPNFNFSKTNFTGAIVTSRFAASVRRRFRSRPIRPSRWRSTTHHSCAIISSSRNSMM